MHVAEHAHNEKLNQTTCNPDICVGCELHAGIVKILQGANLERMKATTRLVFKSLFLTCTEAVVFSATLLKFALQATYCLTTLNCGNLTALLYTDLSVASCPLSCIVCTC